MNNTNKIEEQSTKKIKFLKIAKEAFNILSKAASLVTHPITTGVAIASGLGSIISDSFLDKELEKSNLVPSK